MKSYLAGMTTMNNRYGSTFRIELIPATTAVFAGVIVCAIALLHFLSVGVSEIGRGMESCQYCHVIAVVFGTSMIALAGITLLSSAFRWMQKDFLRATVMGIIMSPCLFLVGGLIFYLC